jgi:hypothetical protein
MTTVRSGNGLVDILKAPAKVKTGVRSGAGKADIVDH